MKITPELVENLGLAFSNQFRESAGMPKISLEEFRDKLRAEEDRRKATTCSHCGSSKYTGHGAG